LRGSLLPRNCIQVLNSLSVQVHSPDTVIVGVVAAVLANEDMPLLITVPLLNMSALWASLAGVLWVYGNDLAPVEFSLVFDFLPEVIERPRDDLVPLPQSDLLCCATDAGQVLQNEQRTRRLTGDKCL